MSWHIQCRMKSASRADVAYERFLFLGSFIVHSFVVRVCLPFFYDFGSQRTTSLIIPNQQMNLGGKIDKAAGKGKWKVGNGKCR